MSVIRPLAMRDLGGGILFYEVASLLTLYGNGVIVNELENISWLDGQEIDHAGPGGRFRVLRQPYGWLILETDKGRRAYWWNPMTGWWWEDVPVSGQTPAPPQSDFRSIISRYGWRKGLWYWLTSRARLK